MMHPVAMRTLDLRDGRVLGHASTERGALTHARKVSHLPCERVSVALVTTPDFISATERTETYWQVGVHLGRES